MAAIGYGILTAVIIGLLLLPITYGLMIDAFNEYWFIPTITFSILIGLALTLITWEGRYRYGSTYRRR